MATTPIPHRKDMANIPMTKQPGPDKRILMIVHANKFIIRNVCRRINKWYLLDKAGIHWEVPFIITYNYMLNRIYDALYW